MSPSLASLIFAVGIGGLFWLDRDPKSRTSYILWLPILWLAILSSRSVSAWLGGSSVTTSGDEYLEGSPLDRALLAGLIVMALLVLIARGRRTGELLRQNLPLVVFLLYCAATALWSDFPLVTFKRWTKTLGTVTMVLIVLTDEDPAAALRQFLTRTAFLLIPMSVLFVKYYPDLGRYYDQWEGTAYYSGVATDKNVLGCTCLILGLGILWRLLYIPKDELRTRRLIAIGIVLGMDLYLFKIANSATSLGCFALGGSLIFVLSRFKRPRPGVVHMMVAGIVTVGLAAYFFGSAFAFLAGSLGRNTTLTGRTDLWDQLTRMNVHPFFGVGFESFFLGDRLDFLWSKYWWHPNEAHNGYLETYLTLGGVGLGLLLLLVVSGYRNVVRCYRAEASAGSLRLAFVVVTLFYNVTEAAFKAMHPMWVVFVLAVAAMPDGWLSQADQTDAPLVTDVATSKVAMTSAGTGPRRWENRRPSDLLPPPLGAGMDAGRRWNSDANRFRSTSTKAR